MSASEPFQHRISAKIRDHAMTFPETAEGTSCVNRAFKAGGKNFLFLGEKEDECKMRLKLGDSIAEMNALNKKAPDRFGVGTGGWTLVRFPPDDPPPLKDLKRWITESFYLLAPKKVLKLLED